MLRSLIFCSQKKYIYVVTVYSAFNLKTSQVKCIHSFKIFIMHGIILNSKENMKTSTFETVQSEV